MPQSMTVRDPKRDAELSAVKSALVLPFLFSFGVTVQNMLPGLEPFRPLGWYGCIHCVSIFILTFLLGELYRAHAHLMLSTMGYVVCSAYSSEQNDMLFKMVLLFLLPIASTWEVINGKQTPDTCLAIYFVVHFSMTCAQFREDFWGTGWQFCLVSMVFNLVLLQLVRMMKQDKGAKSDQSYYHIMDLLRESGLSDGYCILNSKGTILMCDSNLATLLGAVVGKKFSSILSRADSPGDESSDDEDDAPMEGQRANIPIHASDGRKIKVDICTVRCVLPSAKEFNSILDLPGDTRASQESVTYIRAIRHRQLRRRGGTGVSGSEEARNAAKNEALACGTEASTLPDGLWDQDEKTKLTWKALQVKSLSEVQGNDLLDLSKLSPSNMRQPRTGKITDDDMCSHVSSSVAFCQDLTNRRMDLLKRQAPWSFNDYSTPVIVEMDLPLSREASLVSGGDESSVVSSSLVHARVRVQSGAKRKSDGSTVSSSDPRTHMTGTLEEDDEEEEEHEDVPTEVVQLGPGASEGTARVRIGFRSQVLGFQRAELESAKKELHVKGEVQEDQKELLRTFGKIVTRDFKDGAQGSSSMTDPPNVIGIIVEEDQGRREELERLCGELQIHRQAFDHIEAGVDAVNRLRVPWLGKADAIAHSHSEEGKSRLSKSIAHYSSEGGATSDAAMSSEAEGHAIQKPTWSWRLQRLWNCDGAAKECENAWVNDPRRPPAPIVILGASMLQHLPAHWCALKISVTLVYTTEDFEDVTKFLGVRDKADVLNRLRSWGVTEVLEYPVSLASMRCLAQEALRRSYGDDFLLAQQLGRGATCTVYSAKRLRDGEVFALKEINVSRMLRRRCGEQDLQKVAAEMEILRNLEWPTVLYAFDTWWAEDRKLVYMLMPTLTGGDLRNRIEAKIKGKDPCYSADLAATWYSQTLHGLAYLHWCGVLHRDIKPENLLLDANGRSLRIADLGTAALLPEAGRDMTRKQSCIEKASVTTPQTTAPEVFTRKLHYPSSDIWSVGATFYEVVSLEPLLPSINSLERYEELVLAIDAAKGHEIRKSLGLVISRDSQEGHEPLPVELPDELASLLCQDVFQRPFAAQLVRQQHNMVRLQKVLAGELHFEGHFEDLEQVLKESNQGGDGASDLSGRSSFASES